MRIVSVRIHNDIRLYGYAYDDSNTLYWSMTLYSNAWHPLGLFYKK